MNNDSEEKWWNEVSTWNTKFSDDQFGIKKSKVQHKFIQELALEDDLRQMNKSVSENQKNLERLWVEKTGHTPVVTPFVTP